jgi:hypothetical protein
MRFPSTLNGDRHNFVKFKAFGRGGAGAGEVSLYSPMAHTVADGASFGNFDMGIIGGEIENMFTEDGSVDANSLKEKLKASASTGNQSLNSAILAKAFSNFGMGSAISDRIADLTLQNQNVALNPNTVVQYSNSEIRSYNFNFKLVAENAPESNIIKSIVDTFRINMYAEKQGITLQYPSKWDISFHTAGGGVNPFIPKIFKCYLESMSATYNTSSTMTHAGGAPMEVDVQLTFRETKALSKQEIQQLL